MSEGVILDAGIVVLTGLIAIAAARMAIGLLMRQPDYVAGLAAVGFQSPAWPMVFGLLLLGSVIGLIIGWWVAAVGIVAIIVIKGLYTLWLVAHRRAGQNRDRDPVSVFMTAHSLLAVVSVVLLAAS